MRNRRPPSTRLLPLRHHHRRPSTRLRIRHTQHHLTHRCRLQSTPSWSSQILHSSASPPLTLYSAHSCALLAPFILSLTFTSSSSFTSYFLFFFFFYFFYFTPLLLVPRDAPASRTSSSSPALARLSPPSPPPYIRALVLCAASRGWCGRGCV
ncbi:unnamed protein product [Hydatigera taeniaeformis]|uniref:Uncharacterized protein n=1 Tax=Hydatigena taeniaeformis TaxID=6205 RepID=A0A0R3WRK9_HYDTA|nr:unnamed protein product [Hydatigera taeniaeformis]